VAKYDRTEGICLRRLDYGNTSQVATFLTPDSGCLSFIAKGLLRAPKRGVRAGLESLSRYELLYVRRRTGSLHNLTDSSLLESFRGIRWRLERILCAYYAAELALNLTAEGDPCPGFYDELVGALRRFEKGENLGLSVLLLEIAALRHYGACPTFDQCAECERKLPGDGRLLFSLPHGGALCPQCARRMRRQLASRAAPVKAGRLVLLARLAGQATAPALMPRPAPREIVAASRLLRYHMRYLLSKELKMWRYLQDRHLSRALQRVRAIAQA